MSQLVWSHSALLDVQQAYRFLVGKNKDAAKRAVKAIRESIKKIEDHPEIGKPVNEMPTEFREWIISFGDSGYVALYRYDGKETVILSVRHQKEVGY